MEGAASSSSTTPTSSAAPMTAPPGEVPLSAATGMLLDAVAAVTEKLPDVFVTGTLTDAAAADTGTEDAATKMLLDTADARTEKIPDVVATGTLTGTDTASPTKHQDAAAATSTAVISDVNASAAPATFTTSPVTFDVARANTLVVDWAGLDAFLNKFLVDVLGESEDVIMGHAGLFLIPRQEQILDLLKLKKYDEARVFFDSSIMPLKQSISDYRPLDLDQRIMNLDTLINQMVKKRSSPVTGERMVGLQLAVTDYVLLYFPNAIRGEEEGADGNTGLWQFVVKIQFPPENENQKPRKSFRCVACQWECPPSQYGMASIGYHIVHAQDRKICPRVTQNMLNRLSSVSATKEGAPDMVSLAEKFKSKKPKSSSGLSPSWKIISVPPSGPSPSASTGSEFTGAFNTPSIAVDAKFVSEKAWALRRIAESLVDGLGPSLSAADREFVVGKALEFEDLASSLTTGCYKAKAKSGQGLVASARSRLSIGAPSESRQEPPNNRASVVDSPCEATTRSTSSIGALSEARAGPEMTPAATEDRLAGGQGGGGPNIGGHDPADAGAAAATAQDVARP